MIEAGLEAILIKVAGIGLTAKHLGKTLAQMQPTLRKLVGVSILPTSHTIDHLPFRTRYTDRTFAVKAVNTRL